MKCHQIGSRTVDTARIMSQKLHMNGINRKGVEPSEAIIAVQFSTRTVLSVWHTQIMPRYYPTALVYRHSNLLVLLILRMFCSPRKANIKQTLRERSTVPQLKILARELHFTFFMP